MLPINEISYIYPSYENAQPSFVGLRRKKPTTGFVVTRLSNKP